MDLLKIPLFSGRFFKHAKFLISTPQKAQKTLAILETGTVGTELLPMSTAFCQSEETKRAWASVHALKFQIYKDGQPTTQDPVLVITERCYTPLDPLGTLKTKEKEKLSSLNDIAKVRHAQARAAAGHQDNHRNMAELVVQSGFFLLGIYALVTVLKGCGASG